MKHGPIALIDDGVPVVVLAPQGPGYEKVLSNLRRCAPATATSSRIGTKGDEQLGGAVRPRALRSPTRRRCCSRS